jgi:hypothetical protein
MSSNGNSQIQPTDPQIVLYQPNESVRLEVKLDQDTVWLNRQQIAQLFGRDIKTIGKHINNALREELAESIGANKATVGDKDSQVVAKFATTANDGKVYQVEYYNLDVILSVGYRVKSSQGIQFRRWANMVLREYLLQGYSVNRHLIALQESMDRRMTHIEDIQARQQEQLDFYIRMATPPAQGIFYDGQIYDAYTFVSDLVKSAKTSILLIDNYVDDTVLTLLDKRPTGVTATIYTHQISRQFRLDLDRHNAQYPPIEVKTFRQSHDRFLCIDAAVYHIGASIKDLGKRWCAFSRMEILTPDELIARLPR